MDTTTIAIIVLSLVILSFIVSALTTAARRRADERAAGLTTETLARGWALDTDTRGAVHVLRWTGMEDGIRWVAESVEGPSGGRNRQRTTRTCWRTQGPFQPMSTVLLMGMPPGTELPKGDSLGDGFFAQVAMKAVYFALDKGIDGYFGEEIGRQIDANDLKRVEAVEGQLPGFAVMAAVPADASHIVTDSVAAAVRTATQDPSMHQARTRPWVLFWKEGVAVGLTEAVQTPSDLEPIVRLGAAVARGVHRF